MSKPEPRVLAICILRRGDSILVAEGYDRVKSETFYRPLGGKVEFGEYGHQALSRELREEIGAEIVNIQFIGLVENIFLYEGRPGHEIVLVYEGDFAEKTFLEKDVIDGLEKFPEGVTGIKAVWKSLLYFKEGKAPLYPERLLNLITEGAKQNVASSAKTLVPSRTRKK